MSLINTIIKEKGSELRVKNWGMKNCLWVSLLVPEQFAVFDRISINHSDEHILSKYISGIDWLPMVFCDNYEEGIELLKAKLESEVQEPANINSWFEAVTDCVIHIDNTCDGVSEFNINKGILRKLNTTWTESIFIPKELWAKY